MKPLAFALLIGLASNAPLLADTSDLVAKIDQAQEDLARRAAERERQNRINTVIQAEKTRK